MVEVLSVVAQVPALMMLTFAPAYGIAEAPLPAVISGTCVVLLSTVRLRQQQSTGTLTVA